MSGNADYGDLVGELSVMDVDGGDYHTYEIVGGTAGAAFALSGVNNSKMVVLHEDTLDNLHPSATVLVRATDSGGLTELHTFTIQVGKVNDDRLALMIVISLILAFVAGVLYVVLTKCAATGGAAAAEAADKSQV